MTKDEIKKKLDCTARITGNELVKGAFNLIIEQEHEIEQLKAEFKQLETNAEILARGVRDLNHENYELTEKIKQAKIDVLNELKAKSYVNNYCREVVEVEKIDELLKEYE